MGIFSSDRSTSTSLNTSNNISNTTTTNTSSNSTVNDTNTLTQDRRTVSDHGIGISSDNSSVSLFQSGNTTENYISNTTSTDHGAVMGGLGLANAGIASNNSIAGKAIDVSTALAKIGASMQDANIAFLQHVGDQNAASARSAISEVVTATGNALNQIGTIASKPLNANDPQRLVIIVGLAVVGLVFFSKMKG